MKRTLLTGFGPFGDIASNPSQRVAEHFAKTGADGHVLTIHVFPVSYAAVEQQLTALLGAAGSVPFDNVVMLGVNGGATEWRIERIGVNADQPGSIDMNGQRAADGTIIPGMPQELECTLPIDHLVDSLNKSGIPAVISNSAGGYLCNHLLFRAMCRLQTAPGVSAGFIHIPPDSSTFAEHSGRNLRELPSFAMHVRAIDTVLFELG